MSVSRRGFLQGFVSSVTATGLYIATQQSELMAPLLERDPVAVMLVPKTPPLVGQPGAHRVHRESEPYLQATLMFGIDFVQDLVQRAEKIERERAGQALLPEEVDILVAAAFVRQVAPYLFEEPPAK